MASCAEKKPFLNVYVMAFSESHDGVASEPPGDRTSDQVSSSDLWIYLDAMWASVQARVKAFLKNSVG